jgi:hypothetical protein
MMSGNYNTGVGYFTLSVNNLGYDNSAFGGLSLNNNTAGFNNTASGYQALFRNQTGSNNTALGSYAGVTANSQTDYNITGSKNTYLGAYAGAGIPETTAVLNNATAIGYNALVSQSNSLVLGGTGADAVNVGIGTAVPSQRLEVVGTVKATNFMGDITGTTHLNDNTVYLRGDAYHGLGWSNSFGGVSLDGPALFGCTSGVLGTACSGQAAALKWDNSGNVTVTGAVRYATPKTRHWSINGGDFIPNDAAPTYSKVNSILYSTTGAFTAPVHLPDGAVVTKLKIFYLDNSGSSFNVALWRFNMLNSFDSMAYINTTNTSTLVFATMENATISSATIDNSSYAYTLYLIGMDGTANHRLGGVVIEYAVTEPLP